MNWLLLKNSLLVAGSATTASAFFGTLAALWMNCLSMKWRRLWLIGAIISLAMPPFLVTNCWIDWLGEGGFLRAWLPLNIFSLTGTVWVLTLLLWPMTSLWVLADLQKLDVALLESDPFLRGRTLIRYLLLPVVRPALIQASLLTFILALNNFAVPAILQTKVFPAELWVDFNTTFDYSSALKLSWPLLVVPLILAAWLGRAAFSWPRLSGGIAPERFRRQLGRTSFSLAGFSTIFMMGFSLAAPAIQLGSSQRTWLELPGALAASHSPLLNSLWSSTSAACLCIALGVSTWRWRLVSMTWVILLLPGVVLGMMLIFVFNRSGLVAFYQSLGIVTLGLSLHYAGLAWTGSRRAMESVDAALVDYARLNGARGWAMFRQVLLPQVIRPLAALWFIIYLLCLWDVETLVLIIPPGGETLALRIFNLLHYGHNAQVNALCVLLLALAVSPLILWSALQWMAQSDRLRWRFLNHAATLIVCLPWACGIGCSSSVSKDETPIESQIFRTVRIIGSRGTALGQFNKPRSLTVDRQDNLYVVDMTGRIQKFSSNGVYLTSWQMPEIEKGRPKGMCIDSDGNIVVVEPHYSRVNHFSPEGKLVSQWGRHGTNNGELTLPRAAALTSAGDLLICEYTLVDRVQEFTAQGRQWKMTFGQSGLGPGEFNRPEGLAIDAQGRIYVADSCNHRIQIFSPDGKFIRAYGKAGSGLGELSYPYDIRLDAAGFQYVCEFGNSRVQVFDPQGKPVEIIGKAGPAPGDFSNPWSLAFDSVGNLYVADSQNHRVQKFIRKVPMPQGHGTALASAPMEHAEAVANVRAAQPLR